jgi:hypothetical protein
MSLAKALGKRRAALMRGHGCVVTGESVREAVFVAVYMQANAELVMRSRSMGEVNYLSDGEIRLAAELHDALRELIGMPLLLVGMDQELVGNALGVQAARHEMVATIAQHAVIGDGRNSMERLRWCRSC